MMKELLTLQLLPLSPLLQEDDEGAIFLHSASIEEEIFCYFGIKYFIVIRFTFLPLF